MADDQSPSDSDSASEKILILTFLCLMTAVCLAIFLCDIYARCWRFRRHRRGLNSSSNLTAIDVSSEGLDLSAVHSIPIFVYESKSQQSPLDCAVCLSEFEDNETGRVLPDCKHCFHVDCIDTWFLSHSDCPVCRTRVKETGSESA